MYCWIMESFIYKTSLRTLLKQVHLQYLFMKNILPLKSLMHIKSCPTQPWELYVTQQQRWEEVNARSIIFSVNVIWACEQNTLLWRKSVLLPSKHLNKPCENLLWKCQNNPKGLIKPKRKTWEVGSWYSKSNQSYTNETQMMGNYLRIKCLGSFYSLPGIAWETSGPAFMTPLSLFHL